MECSLDSAGDIRPPSTFDLKAYLVCVSLNFPGANPFL